MLSFEIYPQSPSEIDVSKIQWLFWQKSYGYRFCEQYICLFNCDTKAVDANGNPINTLGTMQFTYKAFGNFSLYKTFKMSNGEHGIDIGCPIKSISISSETQGQGLYEFKQIGIFESLNQHLLSVGISQSIA